MKIHLETLGCKLNQSEIEALARRFLASGHEIVREAAQADIVILNTCTVTHVAARKSRQALRRLRRDNPNAFLIATGCAAEMSAAELASIANVDLVIGNPAKENIPDILATSVPSYSCAPGDAGSKRLGPLSGALLRTRALIKIQDGCNNACTYCLVWKARGRAKSRPRAEIIDEIRARAADGYLEAVLTGVHVGSYGREFGDSLVGLVQATLKETDIARLRLSSIEPWDFDPALLSLWPEKRLCRHLHLPLQSGCDATLRRMGRRYSTREFAEIVTRARQSVPEMAVTTDVIVGFPGETDAEFAASLEFVRQQHFARVHVFPYSIRPGTLAAEMPDQLNPEEKEARSRAMQMVGDESLRAFQEQFLGQVFDVLWENRQRRGDTEPLWKGLTDNYIPAVTPSAESLANTIRPARLLSWQEEAVLAELQ
jgi:threonylcarbamoyladenosine tRNA methylthiotransferase MtaB